MPRAITSHIVNPVNDRLEINVMDEPGPGGANHEYEIIGVPGDSRIELLFQKGPIVEGRINGITQEVLLAIVIDRLEGFQRGPFACPENQAALSHILAAQEILHARTKERMRRGVEGSLQK